MSSNRQFLIGLAAWETCVIAFFLAALAWTGTHIWSKNDFIWVAELTVCGVVVVGIIAIFSPKVGRIGRAIVGSLFGLLPSALMFGWAVLAKRGFEESAGAAGFAYMLAAPSAIGGALAGIMRSRRQRHQAS